LVAAAACSESGGGATALQKDMALDESFVECGGLAPLWTGGVPEF
jgi:hypothetical protein